MEAFDFMTQWVATESLTLFVLKAFVHSVCVIHNFFRYVLVFYNIAYWWFAFVYHPICDGVPISPILLPIFFTSYTSSILKLRQANVATWQSCNFKATKQTITIMFINKVRKIFMIILNQNYKHIRHTLFNLLKYLRSNGYEEYPICINIKH